MPDASTYSGVPVPTSTEADDVPAVLAAFRSTMDPQLVLKATSVSNRDTLYGGTTGATAVPAGTLVSCAALKTVWQKTSTPPLAATWVTVAEVGTAVTTGVVTAATNFAVSGQWAQRINGTNCIRIKLTYSGSDLVGAPVTAGTPGSLSDTTMCTLQSAWQVQSASSGFWFACLAGAGGGWAQITAGNDVQLAALGPSGKVTSGDSILFAVTYPGV